MKVGSLVTMIKDWANSDKAEAIVLGINVPVFKEIYTARLVQTCECGCNHTSILLQEIKNHVDEDGWEYCFPIEEFREIQPPISIADIFENELNEVV